MIRPPLLSAALTKKIKAQLEGIDHLEKLTLALMHLGIGNMNAKSAHEAEEQAKHYGLRFIVVSRRTAAGAAQTLLEQVREQSG